MINIEYFANKVRGGQEAVPKTPATSQLATIVNSGDRIMIDLSRPRFELLTSSEEDVLSHST